MQPDSLFLLQNGQQTGPFPREAVRQMLKAGTITPLDYVWAEGMPEWVAAGTLFEAEGGAGAGAGGTSTPPESESDPVDDDLPVEKGFGALVLDAFTYPFRGDGLLILILGSILFTVLGFVGQFSLYISAVTWGYLLLMLQQVIHATAMGEDNVPNWPDFDGFGELFIKALQWFGVLAVCYGPAFGLVVTAKGDNEDTFVILAAIAFLGGSICFPMAILSVAMHDTVGGLNPVTVFQGMFRVPGHYLLVLVVFVGLFGLQWATGKLSEVVPYAGPFIDKLDELWSAVFLARVLGALYRVNRRKLSWFGE